MPKPRTFCSVEGCETRCAGGGLCDKHYRRMKKHGDPLALSSYRTPKIPVEERLWPKVNKRGPKPAARPNLGRCWVWTAGTDSRGYGIILVGRSPRRAHIVVYELLVGKVPRGLELDHLCRRHECVNPSHLEPVTHAENVRRGMGGWNSRAKTECPQGHAYDEANTYRDKLGHRFCRKCLAAKKRRQKARKRAEVLQGLAA